MTTQGHPHNEGTFGLDPFAAADCSEVKRRLYEFIDGEMEPAEWTRLKEHLDHCGECMTRHDRDTLLKKVVRRSCESVAAPVELRLNIMQRIAAATQAPPPAEKQS